jgi:hypothetical protein
MAESERPRTTSEDEATELEVFALAEQFAAELRVGRAPCLSAYLERYPQYAAQLTDFVADLLADEPEAALGPASTSTALAPDTVRALDILFAAEPTDEQAHLARVAEQPAEYVAGRGLLAAAHAKGISTHALAAATDLSPQLLSLLDTKTVTGAEVPPALVARLGGALGLPPTQVKGLLRRAEAPALPAEGLRELLTMHPSLRDEQRARWRRALGG